MNKKTLKANLCLTLVAFLIITIAMGIASAGFIPAAEAVSYSQTEFAVTDHASFIDVLNYKSNNFSGKTIRLYCDIDVSCLPGGSDDVYFSSFAGTFDGNGHVISGCTRNMFGTISSTGTVRDVVFSDCALTSSVALAQANYGLVSGVTFHGGQTATFVNGVVANNYGEMTGVKSYLSIVVSSKSSVYLLAGSFNNSLSDSYFAGSVECTYYTGPWQCSNTKEKTVVYTDGQNTTDVLNVSSCDCNVFAVVRDSGMTTSLTSHPATVPSSTIDLFDDLGAAYGDLVGHYSITDTNEVWRPVENTTEYDDFAAVFDGVKALYGNSVLSYARNASGTLTSGAIVGGNKPFLISVGEDAGRTYADYQTVVSRLFGYDDVSAFTADMTTIVDYFAANAAGASTASVADRLIYNGAAYTSDGYFILPYLFKSAFLNVPVCAVLDPSGVLSFWLGDAEALFTMTNFDNSASMRYAELYGRCALFDSPSSADAYTVQVAESGGTYTKTTTYDYLDVFPYGGGQISNGTVSGCAVFAEIKTVLLPVGLFPYLQNCEDCSGVYRLFSSFEQPAVCYAADLNNQDVEVVTSEDALFTGAISSYLIAPSQSATDSYQTVFYNSGTLSAPALGSITKTWDHAGTVADDFTSWSPAAFNMLAGYYPVQSSFLSGGDISAPITLSDAEDFFKLRLLVRESGTNAAYANLTDSVDFAGRERIRALVGPVTLNISGNYALYGISSDPFDGGFEVTSAATLARPDAVTQFSNATTTSVSGIALTKGAGTAGDPYVIENAGQLVSFINDSVKNVSGNYAVLSKDIIINLQQSDADRLSLSSAVLSATLDGCGHSVYGLCAEPLVGTVAATGKIRNLTIYAPEAIGQDAAAAVCLVNNGTISGVTVYGTGTYESAFVSENNGLITLCHNSLPATYAFSETGTGTISYSINAASACLYFGEGCVQCVSVSGDDYLLLSGGETNAYASAGYLVLEENGYDMNVFAYETGVATSVLPVLRKIGGSYKTETELDVYTQENTLTFGETYITGDFIDEDEPNVTLTWTYTYGGVTTEIAASDLEDDEVTKEVGTYVLTITAKETALTLPKKVIRSFDIVKADCPIKASNVTFNSLTGASGITYTGRSVLTSAVELNGSDAYVRQLVETYGYTFAYAYTSGGNAVNVTDIIEAGTYGQSFVASSKNYKDISRTARSIEIKKAPLTVTVTGSVEVRYGSAALLSAFSAESTFLGKDADASMTLQSIADYASRFHTDYQVGQNAGTVASVWFSTAGITLKNYYFTATNFSGGTITVIKAPIAQGDIYFYGATAVSHGSYEATYTGAAHVLSATGIPAGVGYEYNVTPSFTQAGDYTLILTVDDDGSDDNYEELVLTVDVAIEKAELTLTADDVEKHYGYVVSYQDFSYRVSGLCGSDTESVLDGLHLSVKPAFDQGDEPGYGEYDIDFSADAFETDNYVLVTVPGTFTIVKIPLTTLYVNNAGGANTDFDNGGKEYDGDAFDLSAINVTYFEQNGITVEISYAYFKDGVSVGPGATNAGTYTIVATVTPPAESNYSAVNYTCEYVITKKPTSVRFVAAPGYPSHFSGGAYSYEYVPGGTVNYGTTTYCPYEADVPSGAEMQYGGDMAVYVGTYTKTVLYAGDQNHEGCSAAATVTVTPFTVTVSVTRDYTYSATAILPVVSVSDTDELTDASFTYAYTDNFGAHPTGLRDAGEYTLTLGCKNGNYVLAQNTFPVVVAPYLASVTLPSFSFDYGTTGNYTYAVGGQEYRFYIGNNYVILYGYIIPHSSDPLLAVDVSVDVRFRLYATDFGGYFPAGDYTAQGIEQPNNFTLSVANTATVSVQKKTLTVQWLIDNGYGFEEVDGSFTMTYSGVSRNGAVSYEMSGFAEGETMTNVDPSFSIVKRYSANLVNTILNVGEYSCSVSLGNRLNYNLDSGSSVFVVRVQKKAIGIYVADATVQQKERFVGTQVTTGPSDLVGIDVGKSLSQLAGYSLRYVCAYNDNIATATVGSKYGINVQLTFDNYVPNVVLNEDNAAATLTVVANPLPEYNMSGRTYVYDGTPKSLYISSVDSSVTVTYTNNNKTDVGRYTVVAHIYYPSGREAVTSAELVIEKATPTVVLEPSYLAYKEKTTLDGSVIIGRAYVGDGFAVTGTFAFSAENKMVPGEKKYSASFTPDDTVNVNPVNNLTVTVKCYNFGESLLRSTGDYIRIGDVIRIKNRVTFELNRDSIAEISDRVELYQNGSYVQNFIFKEAGAEHVEIRFDGEAVFSADYTIEMAEEEKEQEADVRINEKMFSLQELAIDAKNGVIYVGESGGRIALQDKYLEDYELYVDGIKVGSAGISTSMISQTVSVEIRHKVIGTVYRKDFVLKNAEEMPAESTEPEKTGLPSYAYIIIAVAGVVLVGGLLLLLLRGRH